MIRLLAIACATAGAGCIVLPPSEASYGAASTAHGAGYRTSVGAHSASADADDDVEWDVGAGWVREGGRRRDPADGTYIALARRLPWGAQRTWLGVRGEKFWSVHDPDEPTRGVVVRTAYRYRLAGGAASDRDGFVHGTFAIGLYADVGVRELAGGAGEVFTSFGVSVDLPVVAGATRGSAFIFFK